MRTFPRICAAVGLAAIVTAGAANAEAASAAASNSVTPPPTLKVVVRPVTTAGHARAGFAVLAQTSVAVDCRFKTPSPGAVSRNIEVCFPTAEYAIACWKAAIPHHVLCMRHPRSKHLVRIRRQGAFAPTRLAPRRQRGPLLIRLGDGTQCAIRDGGAWPQLPGHPNLFGTYSCGSDGAVWAFAMAGHQGVNESHPTWTVRTARFGSHKLTTRRVVKAWFVGTASA